MAEAINARAFFEVSKARFLSAETPQKTIAAVVIAISAV